MTGIRIEAPNHAKSPALAGSLYLKTTKSRVVVVLDALSEGSPLPPAVSSKVVAMKEPTTQPGIAQYTCHL